MMERFINKLKNFQTLTYEESKEVMDIILSGKAKEEEILIFLNKMSDRHETIDEICGMAEVLRSKSLEIKVDESVLGISGTGGSGLRRFNVSTISAFVLASLGLFVTKHGDKAHSGKVGCFDLLEKLGAKIDLDPDQVELTLKKTGLGFMYDPIFQPSLSFVASVRHKIGKKTIFNIISPLINSSNADYQIVGVFSGQLGEKLSKCLIRLGVNRSLIVHGHDGLDEITVSDTTTIYEIIDGIVRKHLINPEYMGIKFAKFYDIEGGDLSMNTAIIKNIIEGKERTHRQDMVVLNAAAGLYVYGKVPDLRLGIEMAREALVSGKVKEKLEEYIDVSRSV